MEKIIFISCSVLILFAYMKVEIRYLDGMPIRGGSLASLDAVGLRILAVLTLLPTILMGMGVVLVGLSPLILIIPLVWSVFTFCKAFLILKESLLYKKVEELKYYDRIVLKILRMYSGIIKRKMPFDLLYEDQTRSRIMRLGKKIIGIAPMSDNEEFVLELFDMEGEYSYENIPNDWKLPHFDDMMSFKKIVNQDDMNEIIHIGGMPMNLQRRYWCSIQYQVYASSEMKSAALVRRLVEV